MAVKFGSVEAHISDQDFIFPGIQLAVMDVIFCLYSSIRALSYVKIQAILKRKMKCYTVNFHLYHPPRSKYNVVTNVNCDNSELMT